MKPSCCLIASDGFDKCVLRNLEICYKKLGFRIVLSRKPINCNLNVFLRGNPRPKGPHPIDCDGYHIWAYVGVSVDPLVDFIGEHPFIGFTMSPRIPSRREDKLAKNFQQCLLPVYPDSAETGIKKRPIDLIHLGNFKSIRNDPVYKAFLDFMSHARPLIVGRGWETHNISHRLHPRVDVAYVNQIYSRSNLALGIMYPFQREIGTYSSRFWQAPINGCPLLSEDSYWAGKMPGVYKVDYREVSPPVFDNQKLLQEARSWWLITTRKSEIAISNSLAEVLSCKPRWIRFKDLLGSFHLRAKLSAGKFFHHIKNNDFR